MVIKTVYRWFNPIFQRRSPDPSLQQRTSLIHTTLLNMALRVSGVMLISAVVSYFHVMDSLEQQTKNRLEQYIVERGQKESASFQVVEQNHATLKREFLARLKAIDTQNVNTRFNQIFSARPDGTLRTDPMLYVGKPQADGSVIQSMNGVIFKKESATLHVRQQVMIAYDLLSAYAPALRKELESIYTFIPDGSGMAYSPSVPWNLEASATQDFTQQEWAYTADILHNPTRTDRWTGIYYEPTFKTYFVTCVTPIDVPGYLPFTIGSDLSINTLLEKTVQDRLEDGTYNIILRGDGRLIAHPQLMQKLEHNKGQLLIQDIGDEHLERVFQLVKNARADQHVIDNETDKEYLAVTKIEGPDWFLITVYPKKLLSSFAFETVQFVLISGLAALLIELGLLFSVLRQHIARPLHRLLNATDRLSEGKFDIHLEMNRKDEIGRLASSFNSMASQLKDSFTALEQANTDLEKRVEERTVELKNTLRELQRTQSQIVQSEKMSALGQMVAGIAHEINNPINFIHGNLDYVERYTQDLLDLLTMYQEHYPEPPRSLQTMLDMVELDFLQTDLGKTLQSMRIGTERICEIIKSLRNFSRLDEAEFKAVDIHEGLDNTLMILRHRLKANPQRPEIQVVKTYGALPLIQCYAGQLNQVFMNILSNAIDALDEQMQEELLDYDTYSGTIWVHTEVLDNDWISIQIADNGMGVNDAVRSSIFDPFFTTKTTAKGTGLGLSISYRIITERHGGKLWCESAEGEGTKFVITMPIHQMATVQSERSAV